MAYRGQFERLIRAQERGQAVTSTRTIAVFDDGLVVCSVGIYGELRPGRGIFGGFRPMGRRPVRRASGPHRGDDQIRERARAAGSGVSFAEAWPGAELVPVAVIEAVVVTRPRQVSEFAIYEETTGTADAACSTYLGDLSADQVRETLGPVLGQRLQVEIPE